MDFTEFIKDDPKGPSVRARKQEAPQLFDPIIRRYHIIRLSVNACGVYLAAWSTRLLA